MGQNESKHGKVACLLAAGFEDSEFRVPVDRLREAGYQVDVIGMKAGEKLHGEKGKETVTTDLGIDDADVDRYVGLLIPGGYSPDKLRADDRFVQFVKDFDATKRPLAAVCHGPQLLLTAELTKGRTLTAWTTVQGDLRQAGARRRPGSGRRRQLDHQPQARRPAGLLGQLLEELGELEESTAVQAPNEQALPPLA